jgi:hypothetical protein
MHEEFLRERIEAVLPGAYDQLESLQALEDQVAQKIAVIIVESCQGQHVGGITAGRKAFKRLPSRWVEVHLQELVPQAIDLADEWEYRRLLEKLEEAKSSLVPYYVELGTRSTNPEIQEAAEDYRNGT